MRVCMLVFAGLLCLKFFPLPVSRFYSGGDEGIRTPDPLLARQVLSQLSYIPL